MRVIETNRLILRNFELDDLDDFHEYSKNPEIGLNAGWKYHKDIHESKKILRYIIDSNEMWAIELKDEKKVIGSIGLYEDKKREAVEVKMIGYVLSDKYWGMGIMPEAVNAVLRYGFYLLNLDLVSAYHYDYNIRSKRVLEKCGFKYEGILRLADKRYDGKIVNDVCYSILKEEFNTFSKFENNHKVLR